MARFRIPRADNASVQRVLASFQGVIGTACIVTSVSLLAAPAWGLLVAGGFLLLGALTTGR